MIHCRFIPALQPQCTNPSAHVVLHLAFLSFSRHSSNLSLSPSVPLCIVWGVSLHSLGTARMLKLCISLYCMVRKQKLSILYYQVGRLFTFRNKKKAGGKKLSKRQQYNPTNNLRDFFKPLGINPHCAAVEEGRMKKGFSLVRSDSLLLVFVRHLGTEERF